MTNNHLFGGYGYCYVYFIVDNGWPNYHSGHKKIYDKVLSCCVFHVHPLFILYWLVVLIILKNDGVRQWEGWHPIYEMEVITTNVPNHQSVYHVLPILGYLSWQFSTRSSQGVVHRDLIVLGPLGPRDAAWLTFFWCCKGPWNSNSR